MLINTVTPTDLTSLKSYEEIVAMATAEGYPRTNTIAELNTAEDEYYDMLNTGGHLGIKAFEDVGDKPYIIGIQNGDELSGYNIKKGGNGNTLWSRGHYIGGIILE